MDFECFKCQKNFGTLKDVCNHLKFIHFIKDHFQPIECVVRNNKNCKKTFSTFASLQTHVKKCQASSNKSTTEVLNKSNCKF